MKAEEFRQKYSPVEYKRDLLAVGFSLEEANELENQYKFFIYDWVSARIDFQETLKRAEQRTLVDRVRYGI